MAIMKDALLKAGIITEKDIKRFEAEKRKKRSRQPVAKSATGKKHDHHVVTTCQECQRTAPDVEHYRHTIKHLKNFWLCCRCADMYNIHDKFRITAQSPHALSGMFRREYGPTLDSSVVARHPSPDEPQATGHKRRT